MSTTLLEEVLPHIEDIALAVYTSAIGDLVITTDTQPNLSKMVSVLLLRNFSISNVRWLSPYVLSLKNRNTRSASAV